MNEFERAVGGMADVPQWFAWKLTPNPTSGKFDKSPCALDGVRSPINAGDPANWSDFDTVAAAVASLDKPGSAQRFAMGFWLTREAGYILIDLDHAMGPDGRWLPFASQLVACYPGAMTETSSSGKGRHIIFMADPPPHRNKPPQDIAAALGRLQLEVYSERRGVCFGLDGHAEGCADARFDLAPFIAAYVPPRVATLLDDSAPRGGFQGSDEELIAKALAARESAAVAFGSTASFADLWHGRVERDSDSDFRLAVRLAWWCGADPDRVQRVMERSGLRRDKWNERRPGGTYLSTTVQRACDECESTYAPPALSSPAAGVDAAASATSDLANAQRLVRAHGQDLMHVPGPGWHVWDGCGPWQQDDGHAQRLAFGLGKRIQAEADALDAWVNDQDINGSEEQKQRAKTQETLRRWARSSEFVVSVRHTLEAAQTMLTVKADALDSNPMLLGAPSGVIDLNTGTQREHRREDRITKCIAVDLDASAKAPTWARFVDRIMSSDAQLIAYLQTISGYMLCGSRGEHALPVFYGTGANGKSTFLATLQSLLGDYSGTASPGLLLARKDSDQLAAIAALRGLRLVVVSESGETERLDESRVKQITGGDRLTGRPLYQNFVEFTPTHLAVLQTNHRPRVTGSDDGIWRRLKLVPFAVTIPAAERDPELADKLRAEFAGILAWMVEGWRMYKRQGFIEPDAVKVATADYRSASDAIGQFINERCNVGPHFNVPSQGLYTFYKIWCAENGEYVMTNKAFSLKLSERPGFVKTKQPSGMVWRGLAIASYASPAASLSLVKP